MPREMLQMECSLARGNEETVSVQLGCAVGNFHYVRGVVVSGEIALLGECGVISLLKMKPILD